MTTIGYAHTLLLLATVAMGAAGNRKGQRMAQYVMASRTIVHCGEPRQLGA